MSSESEYIADGKSLGYEGGDLRTYVRERKEEYKVSELYRIKLENEERKRTADLEREKRAHERELKSMESELELARIQSDRR